MSKIWVGLIVLVLLVVIGCAASDKFAAIGEQLVTGEAAKAVASTSPIIAAILGLLAAGFQTYKKWRGDTKLTAVYTGVDEVKTELTKLLATWKAEGKVPTLDELLQVIDDVLRLKAAAYNVYPEIKADLEVLRKKLKKVKDSV